MTAKYKRLSRFYLFLQLVCLFAPIVVFFFLGILNGEVGATNKFVLGLGTTTALVISAIGLIGKMHLRSPIFIFLMVCHFCIDKFIPILVVFAVCTFLDEIVFEPLYKHYKNLMVINREIDKRYEK